MKTDTTSLLIKLIINPLSATPPLAIEPVSSVIVLPIDPEPEELVGDGIFLQSTVMMSSLRSLRMAALTTLAVDS